ncbi:MAG: arginine--tRNA ligase [Acidobacteriota bacterium]|nr:arginine--tRNA ligase [Acidobacteriota bacterium]MDE3092796.1 arginine--tRNA ligase [Acidobacteriota bacterium]MDE3139577.1 arginine--tRNA ligase [Acidobacteriota bacterium]MDE3145852.1 arginine--tRNA ligase [Acidobacteriota bacterium]
MTCPYDVLLSRLQSAFDHVVVGADPVLRPSDRGDYQANGIMALAKSQGMAPREMAQRVLDVLDLSGVAEVEVAGPGFLNLTLTSEYLDETLRALLDDERLGVATLTPRTAVIDYSAPNVAKEMHVGHLRSTVIGDALARIYRFRGYSVVARSHVGDWGTPFGMLIEHLVDLGEATAMAALSIGDLDGFYRAARVKFESDEDFRERSRQRVVSLQGGDPETRRLWQILVDESVAYFAEVYSALDVTLTPDDVVGESYYNDMLDAVVTDLDAAGLLVESAGALCVFPEGFTNREGEPLPLIVKKSDEGFGYAATDLAAIRDRVDHLHADELLYVVGAPQSQHFEMVFAVARAAGWLPAALRCEHVAFGNVLGPDRKMFKTRSGETIKLIDLLDEATERAEAALVQRSQDLSPEQRHQLATQIARAAIKYADLSNDRQRDYVFDLERMIAFEGDTGPYLQYAHARLRSIFRRLGTAWDPRAARFSLGADAERDLARGLIAFPEAVDAAMATLHPHRLSGYLFELAQRFTTFYEACPVLSAPEPSRTERLALCDLTARTLRLGLSLLGIEAPEQM